MTRTIAPSGLTAWGPRGPWHLKNEPFPPAQAALLAVMFGVILDWSQLLLSLLDLATGESSI